MKVLFLDIDGVVNSHNTPVVDGWPIDEFMAFLVGRIVDQTGCEVVLSSAWRYSPEGCDIVRKKVWKFIDMTPDHRGTVSRGTEVKEWLDAHPEVEKYAILDDNPDFHKDQMPNLFRTSYYMGLTEAIADQVIKHLK